MRDPSRTGTRKAVFLDRDGVLNHPLVVRGRPHPPRSVDEFALYEEAGEQLQRLRDRGFLLICVTNQPDVSRGKQRREVVDAMHEILTSRLALDDLLVCFESDDGCPRRKPNPGMLIEAARRHGIDLAGSYMIGDRWRDVDAGMRAGCRCVLIDRGYMEELTTAPEKTATSLREAVEWILEQERT